MRNWLRSCDAWLFGGIWQRLSFVAALLIFGMIASAVVIQPDEQQLQSESDKEPMLRSEFRRKLQDVVNLPSLQQYAAQLPPEAMLAHCTAPTLTDVLSIARQAGVDVEQVQTDLNTNITEPLAILTTSAQFKADYARLARFAKAVDSTGGCFALRNQEWNVVPGSDRLSLVATIDIYRELTEQELSTLKQTQAESKAAKP